jgi:hypothetical protein
MNGDKMDMNDKRKPEEGPVSPLSTRILYGCLQRLTIPEAVVI